jgi:hypothetical protein
MKGCLTEVDFLFLFLFFYFLFAGGWRCEMDW